MIVEVVGTNTQNKGAELMLVAIREHMDRNPDVELAVDQFFGSYGERAKYELLQKVTLNRWGRSRVAVHLMPNEFRQAFGLVREGDVDVLLDASGFAFGDQHPAKRTVQFAQRVEAAKRAGKAVVLLPQALGPFKTPVIRDAFARIVDAADLVFARDDQSMQHAEQATGRSDTLWQAPDITTLVRPEQLVNREATERACIVPNERMIEKAATDEEAAAYVPFLGRCIEAVKEEGLRPVLLLHERRDIELVEAIWDEVGRRVSLHTEQDPLALKRFLGNSHLVISSRYHGLVGALSEGVPAIGTSWSHKYEMLFQDYGCADMLLSISASKKQIRRHVRRTVGPNGKELRARIWAYAEEQRAKTQIMWKKVETVLQSVREREGVSSGMLPQTTHVEDEPLEANTSRIRT